MPQGHEDVVSILKSARTIAVLGVKNGPDETSHEIFRYLVKHGYTVYGVNPKLAGTTIEGRPVMATLAELPGRIDIVDIFRDAQHLPTHLADIAAMQPPPRVVWLQQGIRNDAFAAEVRARGITVVQDYCIAVAHSTHRTEITASE